MPLNALITGTSAGGIGSALALALAERGNRVFATLRNPAKIAAEVAQHPNVVVLEMDVTSTASIAAVVKTVSQLISASTAEGDELRFPSGGLDVLINNAGVGYATPLLDADLDIGRRMFETNFWGLLAVTQQFAGLLEKARGMIVNLSSTAAALPTAWFGMYASSKAAVNQVSETLRLELEPLGVRVLTVHAGSVATEFTGNAKPLSLREDSRYLPIQKTIAKWAANRADTQKQGDVKEFVGQLVGHIERRAGGEVWLGSMAGTVKFMRDYAPKWMAYSLLKNAQGINELTGILQEK